MDAVVKYFADVWLFIEVPKQTSCVWPVVELLYILY